MEACRIDCPLKSGCIRHCADNAGYALSKFLTSVDICETQIGDYKCSGRSSSFTHIVSGVQLEFGVQQSHILVGLNSELDVTSKFTNMFNKAPTNLLTEHMRLHSSMYQSGRDKQILARLNGIRANKMIVAPLKPDMQCEIRPEGLDTESVINTKIKSIIWKTSPTTGIFEGYILTDVCDAASNKTYKIQLEDYGTKLRLTKIERTMYANNLDRRTVKMTANGFIQPIGIEDQNDTKLVLDGTYLYQIMHSGVNILGYWEGSELIITKSSRDAGIEKTAAYRHLINSLKYIENHRRFIAPYGVVKEVEIKL